jgi:hypothetical protein
MLKNVETTLHRGKPNALYECYSVIIIILKIFGRKKNLWQYTQTSKTFLEKKNHAVHTNTSSSVDNYIIEIVGKTKNLKKKKVVPSTFSSEKNQRKMFEILPFIIILND